MKCETVKVPDLALDRVEPSNAFSESSYRLDRLWPTRHRAGPASLTAQGWHCDCLTERADGRSEGASRPRSLLFFADQRGESLHRLQTNTQNPVRMERCTSSTVRCTSPTVGCTSQTARYTAWIETCTSSTDKCTSSTQEMHVGVT